MKNISIKIFTVGIVSALMFITATTAFASTNNNSSNNQKSSCGRSIRVLMQKVERKSGCIILCGVISQKNPRTQGQSINDVIFILKSKLPG